MNTCFNHLKDWISSKYIKIQFISHTEHTLSATEAKQLMLFREGKLLLTVRTMENTYIYSVGTLQNFSMLKQMVHIATTGLKELIVLVTVTDL